MQYLFSMKILFHNDSFFGFLTGATLTFKDIHYTVTASTSKEKLELLKGVSGFFASGKMTALMGSSGVYALHSHSFLSL